MTARPRMPFRCLAAVAMVPMLAGCAGGGGLTAGKLPEPAPFVVASRPAPKPGVFPAVGLDAPPRSDVVLTPAERAKLQAELEALALEKPKKKAKPAG